MTPSSFSQCNFVLFFPGTPQKEGAEDEDDDDDDEEPLSLLCPRCPPQSYTQQSLPPSFTASALQEHLETEHGVNIH